MEHSPKISVFTATFNRRHTIHRVFESLQAQSFRNFEWIVVDDGSTDNTEELIHEYKSNARFPIKYIWQRNRGKHTAYNVFASHAQAEYYVSVDSDDGILPHCLERMLFHFEDIPEHQRRHYAGMMCLAQNQFGELIGDRFFQEDMHDDIVSVLLRHKKLGDKGGMNFVSTLREFPFPEDVENVYLPESWHIHQYSTKYKTKFVNEILTMPWTDPRADHLSNVLGTQKNLKGNSYGLLAWPKFSMRHFWRNPRLYASVTSKYVAVSLSLKKSLFSQFSEIGSTAGRLLWLSMIPLGCLRLWIGR